jgi:hypothetical protein
MHALKTLPESDQWLVFLYWPTALFSLKASRATSTVGKSLLIPTPYAVKMAFLDAALRHNLTNDPAGLVRMLADVQVRIGVPDHACVTGTIQRVRQETRVEDRKKDRTLPYYRPTIAMLESGRLPPSITSASVEVLCSIAGWSVAKRWTGRSLSRSSPSIPILWPHSTTSDPERLLMR